MAFLAIQMADQTVRPVLLCSERWCWSCDPGSPSTLTLDTYSGLTCTSRWKTLPLQIIRRGEVSTPVKLECKILPSLCHIKFTKLISFGWKCISSSRGNIPSVMKNDGICIPAMIQWGRGWGWGAKHEFSWSSKTHGPTPRRSVTVGLASDSDNYHRRV